MARAVKDVLAQLVESRPEGVSPTNVAREYVQALILGGLQRSGAMLSIAFKGGTALRFLYRTPRYSEDLDFALELDRSAYDLTAYMRNVQRELAAQGYEVRVAVKEQHNVHTAWVRFVGLLFEIGASPHREQALSVKVEVDTTPPEGAVLETTLVRRFEVLRLLHHDRRSLLVGKINAILTRPYVKGRDVYDLVWHLSDPEHPGPNLALLNNALLQFGWEGGTVTEQNWRELLRERLAGIDWSEVARDVRPFLERSSDEQLVSAESVALVLGR